MKRLSHSLKDPLRQISLVNWVYRKVQYAGELLHKARYNTISKHEFIDDLRNAIENNTGYAAGKIGVSPQHWMYYEIFLKKEKDSAKIEKFEKDLRFHGLKQSGIFPPEPSFYLEFNKFYIEHVKNLDCLGIFYSSWELEMLKHYQLKNKLIDYEAHKIYGSYSMKEKECYLQYFRDKKILLISPFAEILKERATKEIFENVWSKIGKKWFYPKEVDALEFPYGFASETQERYPTALDLFKDITDEIDKKDFDIALISAAGLAIPIASYIKSLGKIGFDLGGHQQLVFGVVGKRWLQWEDWKEKYLNEYWITPPDKYKPTRTDVCDKGAYW